MSTWKQPKNDYTVESQVTPEIFNTLAENERYLYETKITSGQVPDIGISSTLASVRENLSAAETIKTAFGKIRKWFSDLGALAFKSTITQYDIENQAVSMGKIASNAVSTGKIDGKAVTTAKLADGAVTDEKVTDVSASKITGLAAVATSGSYNDLKDKPSNSGGSSTELKFYNFTRIQPPASIETGVYLAFATFTNAGSYSNGVGFGTIVYDPSFDNGSFSSISTIYDRGGYYAAQLQIETKNGKPIVSILSADDESDFPYDEYMGDGGCEITLIKVCDIPNYVPPNSYLVKFVDGTTTLSTQYVASGGYAKDPGTIAPVGWSYYWTVNGSTVNVSTYKITKATTFVLMKSIMA